MRNPLLILLASAVCTILAQSCAPTFDTGPGPIFKFGQPEKHVVCPHDDTHEDVWVGIESGCFGNVCLLRKKEKPANGVRLHLTGTVRSAGSCRALPGAVLDLWQTDANGVYGSMHPGEEDGFCRARLRADDNGDFVVDTEIPGLYGITNGASAAFDIPPFAPKHIHVIVTAPGHELLMSQIYFDDDPTGGHDFRRALGNRDLGANHTETRTHVSPCVRDGVATNCATFDLVLRPTTAETSGSVDERILSTICANLDKYPEASITCHPEYIWLLRLRYVVPVLLAVVSVVLAGSIWLMRRLLSLVGLGGRSPKKQADLRKKRA